MFLVGSDEHDGWPDLWTEKVVTGVGRITVRMPDWHTGEAAEALSEVAGVELVDKINQFWAFPASVDKAAAQQIVAPLLEPGTRLADEGKLAAKIRSSQSYQAVAQQALF